MRERVSETAGTAGFAHDATFEQFVDCRQTARATRARNAARNVHVERVAADGRDGGDAPSLVGESREAPFDDVLDAGCDVDGCRRIERFGNRLVQEERIAFAFRKQRPDVEGDRRRARERRDDLRDLIARQRNEGNANHEPFRREIAQQRA
jgi:hypothetical protein